MLLSASKQNCAAHYENKGLILNKLSIAHPFWNWLFDVIVSLYAMCKEEKHSQVNVLRNVFSLFVVVVFVVCLDSLWENSHASFRLRKLSKLWCLIRDKCRHWDQVRESFTCTSALSLRFFLFLLWPAATLQPFKCPLLCPGEDSAFSCLDSFKHN